MTTFEDLVRAIVREEMAKDAPPKDPVVPVATPKPRGRPPKPVDVPTVVATPAAPEPDPFTEAAPVPTEAEVRAAFVALKEATDQNNAVAVLKTFAANLTSLKPDQYAAAIAAAKAAIPTTKAAVVEADPFGEPAKKLTIEDVKAAAVKAQKRTSRDTVSKVFMARGGQAPNPQGGAMMPSFKALPESEYAATIADLENLPSTK